MEPELLSVFHPQAWIIIVEALAQWAGPTTRRLGVDNVLWARDRVWVTIRGGYDPNVIYDGEVGRIIEVSEDDLGSLTGDERNDRVYRVEFDDEAFGRMTFRHHDLEAVG